MPWQVAQRLTKICSASSAASPALAAEAVDDTDAGVESEGGYEQPRSGQKINSPRAGTGK
jgi:hypothetical protein